MSSDKKINANRENSQHATGPTSPEGKARSCRNAFKTGIFGKELVVEAAGETQEDFDALLRMAQEDFRPRRSVTRFLVGFYVKAQWGLRRCSRCESAEIRRQCETARVRRHFEKISEVNSLKSRFIRDLAAMWAPGLGSADQRALSVSLEETRRQLEKTSLGLDFLNKQVQFIQKELDQQGYFSVQNGVLLTSACGIEDEMANTILLLNQSAKTQVEKSKKDLKEDKSEREEYKLVIWMALSNTLMDIARKEKIIKGLEAVEEEAYLASLAILPAKDSDRIHRSEATHERRLFKAMDYLGAFEGLELSGLK